nr:hypothetical protein [Chryseobacterium sp.]
MKIYNGEPFHDKIFKFILIAQACISRITGFRIFSFGVKEYSTAGGSSEDHTLYFSSFLQHFKVLISGRRTHKGKEEMKEIEAVAADVQKSSLFRMTLPGKLR